MSQKLGGNMSYFTPISLSSPFLDLYERDAPTTSALYILVSTKSRAE